MGDEQRIQMIAFKNIRELLQTTFVIHSESLTRGSEPRAAPRVERTLLSATLKNCHPDRNRSESDGGVEGPCVLRLGVSPRQLTITKLKQATPEPAGTAVLVLMVKLAPGDRADTQ